jgi:restriction system protein
MVYRYRHGRKQVPATTSAISGRRRGEQEQVALDKGLVTIAWNELPDLSSTTTREALADLYRQHNPDASPNKAANHVGQVWAFRERIKRGDLVVLPLHIQSAIAIGKITGPYQYAFGAAKGTASQTRRPTGLHAEGPAQGRV